ncbi:Pre-mRNA-splicing factor 18 [Bagarius yarrelli]|uniref:Pre-mRNA-splicing factor 18 n=1 Tax=Bagarius yarrelli TaxID=175774 RepID=A0A556TQG7_BAGYA|nr:Pre-mRNA-splicing factor 18 [Bagarius yarrelli]
MDILKAEIARKRKLMEEKELVDTTKKYFKRAELARKEEEEYFKRCGYNLEKEKRNQEETAQSTSSNPVPSIRAGAQRGEVTHDPVSPGGTCVIRRLRERGEPVRLFGETDYDAFQRLRKIEILAPEGLRNDLKAAMDKIDQQYLNEIVGGHEAGDPDTQDDLKVHEEHTTIEELEALGESLGTGNDVKDMDVIDKVLRTLSADIKESITDIIKFMLQREYVKSCEVTRGFRVLRLLSENTKPPTEHEESDHILDVDAGGRMVDALIQRG